MIQFSIRHETNDCLPLSCKTHRWILPFLWPRIRRCSTWLVIMIEDLLGWHHFICAILSQPKHKWITPGLKVDITSKFRLLGKWVVYKFLIKIWMIKLILSKTFGGNSRYSFVLSQHFLILCVFFKVFKSM